MATTMNIEVSRAVGPLPVTIFQIEGDIDVNSYEEFQAMGEQAYKDGTRNLLLDLTNVKYIGSAGMRAIH
ncbi:MAG: STAS domain-containing protein, partial [Anaerolineae bacterium]|nr:STAS domain-containing protein [Anaerolineae bacterium]